MVNRYLLYTSVHLDRKDWYVEYASSHSDRVHRSIHYNIKWMQNFVYVKYNYEKSMIKKVIYTKSSVVF